MDLQKGMKCGESKRTVLYQKTVHCLFLSVLQVPTASGFRVCLWYSVIMLLCMRLKCLQLVLYFYFEILFIIFVSMTNSFQQNLLLSKTNICPASHNIRRITCDYNIHYHVRKALSLAFKISRLHQTHFIYCYSLNYFLQIGERKWPSSIRLESLTT